MPQNRPKRPRDSAQLAKLMIDIASGEVQDGPKEPQVSALARKGGLKGGKARAAALTPEQRSEIARAAAAARWKKSLAASISSSQYSRSATSCLAILMQEWGLRLPMASAVVLPQRNNQRHLLS
jgi:hypothetical protein